MNAAREFFRSAAEMEYAFPKVDPKHRPFSYYLLCQIRTPKTMSEGGIFLTEEARETEKWNTQVGKVIAMGPVAFRNRTTLEPWPEQAWCKVGDFVRVPKYGGDRFEVPVPGREEKALFIVIKDLDLNSEIVGDPLSVLAFI